MNTDEKFDRAAFRAVGRVFPGIRSSAHMNLERKVDEEHDKAVRRVQVTDLTEAEALLPEVETY